MAPILNTQSITGLPICLSGITPPPPPPLSEEMADHDRRRKGLKKLRFRGLIRSKRLHAVGAADQELRTSFVAQRNNHQEEEAAVGVGVLTPVRAD
ncbi:hypothetical protein ACH5RR_009925 [Cinchona calisaya]|uniref:Uncharacterized protein n=1 Tax=Cinchona calisaya TaxID=153742 RepID=A0ABD3AH91_9GENT